MQAPAGPEVRREASSGFIGGQVRAQAAAAAADSWKAH